MRHAPATHVLFLHVTQVCVWCVCVCVYNERRAGRLHVQGGLHRRQRSDVSELQPRNIQGSTGPDSVQFVCQWLGSSSFEPIPRTYSTLYGFLWLPITRHGDRR